MINTKNNQINHFICDHHFIVYSLLLSLFIDFQGKIFKSIFIYHSLYLNLYKSCYLIHFLMMIFHLYHFPTFIQSIFKNRLKILIIEFIVCLYLTSFSFQVIMIAIFLYFVVFITVLY